MNIMIMIMMIMMHVCVCVCSPSAACPWCGSASGTAAASSIQLDASTGWSCCGPWPGNAWETDARHFCPRPATDRLPRLSCPARCRSPQGRSIPGLWESDSACVKNEKCMIIWWQGPLGVMVYKLSRGVHAIVPNGDRVVRGGCARRPVQRLRRVLAHGASGNAAPVVCSQTPPRDLARRKDDTSDRLVTSSFDAIAWIITWVMTETRSQTRFYLSRL